VQGRVALGVCQSHIRAGRQKHLDHRQLVEADLRVLIIISWSGMHAFTMQQDI
jgi:hypothetical protein